MPKKKMVDARIDIQFHPHGADYSYNFKDATDEQDKLGKVLDICDRVVKSFSILIPEAKRAWWEGKLKLTSIDKKVMSSEYLGVTNAQLKSCAITHKELEKMRPKLPKDIVWEDGTAFPPPPDPTADPADTAMNFGVVPAPDARAYYAPKGEPPYCCGAMNLQVNEKSLSVRDPWLKNGSIEIMLFVHFDPDQKVS